MNNTNPFPIFSSKNLLLLKNLKSKDKAVWVCGKNHEWESTVHSVTVQKTGCPFCSNLKILTGFNDFATKYPNLLKEWDFSKNTLDPHSIRSNNKTKVWWKCSNGHEWEATVAGRASKSSSCWLCVKQEAIPGVNNIFHIFPEEEKYWSINNVLNPIFIKSSSNVKALWVCDNGHEWEDRIVDFIKKKSKCSACFILNKRSNQNYENINKFWNKNKNSTPIPPTVLSLKNKYWWFCNEGHEWEAKYSHSITCHYCNNIKTLVGYNDLATTNPELSVQWSNKNSLKPTEVTSGSSHKVWWVCDKEHEWESTVFSRKITGCPYCSKSILVSSQENVIQDYLKIMLPNDDIIFNTRKLINKELDIYIPGKNIAVEYNGLYWHSEKFKPKTYHYDKWLACKNQGVQLIQIWEDDWNRNPEQIKRMLAHKLGVSNEEKVYARNTIVKSVSKKEAEAFLNRNHIQGFVSGSYYLGLIDDDNIVAIMVFRSEKNKKQLNLTRYATNKKVVGGFTKLLNYAENTYFPEQIISFSDNIISDGKLYAQNGFILSQELPPDYTYIIHKERKHKFNYRLHRFRDDPELKYVEGFTEKELAELNNLLRIWDAGKIKWIKLLK